MTLKNRYPISRKDFDALKKIIRRYKITNVGIPVSHESTKPIVTVTEEEDIVILKTDKNRLTKKEKLRVLDDLEGSSKNYSKEAIEESWEIANRGEWGNEVND